MLDTEEIIKTLKDFKDIHILQKICYDTGISIDELEKIIEKNQITKDATRKKLNNFFNEDVKFKTEIAKDNYNMLLNQLKHYDSIVWKILTALLAILTIMAMSSALMKNGKNLQTLFIITFLPSFLGGIIFFTLLLIKINEYSIKCITDNDEKNHILLIELYNNWINQSKKLGKCLSRFKKLFIIYIVVIIFTIIAFIVYHIIDFSTLKDFFN